MSERRFMDPWDAYRNDPALKRLVDMLTHVILQAEYTPSEVRQAAMMACIEAEYRRPMPSLYIRTDNLTPAMRLFKGDKK